MKETSLYTLLYIASYVSKNQLTLELCCCEVRLGVQAKVWGAGEY